MSFAGVLSAYDGHAEAAARLARWAWYSKLAMLAVLAVSAGATLVAQLAGAPFHVLGSTSASLAFAIWAIYIAVDPEPRAYAHRATAARLWLLCEKYRALLTEIHDELLDVAAMTARRDGLLRETGFVFEQAAPADRLTYEIARTALAGGRPGHYTDQDVDRFLPVALRRTTTAAS
ncbi:MAG TPA: SLATT domain-containing protein [Rhodanobacteraceae bacterium]|nr:SLATT domain-containing protein [Rhodanobacteraceae bacterium]